MSGKAQRYDEKKEWRRVRPRQDESKEMEEGEKYTRKRVHSSCGTPKRYIYERLSKDLITKSIIAMNNKRRDEDRKVEKGLRR